MREAMMRKWKPLYCYLPPEDLVLWLAVGGVLGEFLRHIGALDTADWVAVVLWVLSPAIVVALDRYLLSRKANARGARDEGQG